MRLRSLRPQLPETQQLLPAPQEPVQPVEIRGSAPTEQGADLDEETGAGAGGDQDMSGTEDGAPNSTQVKRGMEDDKTDRKKSRGSGSSDKAG